MIRRSPLERYESRPGLAAIRSSRLLVEEQPFSGKLLLKVRGDEQTVCSTLQRRLGILLPLVPNTVTGDERIALWLGCGKWMIVCEANGVEKLCRHIDDALENSVHTVSECSDSRVVIRISGSDARSLIGMGCALDLSPTRFVPGRCAQTIYARIPVLIHRIDSSPCFDLYVDTSLCIYFWEYLLDASQEFLAPGLDSQGPGNANET